MDPDIAISVENISKAYRIWETPAARLLSPIQEGVARLLPGRSRAARHLSKRAAGRYRDFHALRDISFVVKRGEAVGIIGRNGSGKSTLLQIIAGTLQPTSGTVRVKGRVAALLELGSGFNPEFTGRENVYLNGAVLGLSRREVDERIDSIIAFADIGDFLDEPVRTFSSGMMVRLAFAVAVCRRPEVLIVDEALAVGDAGFQRKCYRRIEELREGGTSLLFVSHDINAVSQLCGGALLLECGSSVFHGDPIETGNRYQQLIFGEAVQTSMKQYGNGDASFSSFWLEDMDGAGIEFLPSARPARFCYSVRFKAGIKEPVFGFRVVNVHGTLLLSTNTAMLQIKTGEFQAGEQVTVKWQVNLPVVPGYVFFSAGVSHSERDEFFCRQLDALKISVQGKFNNAGILGTVEADAFGCHRIPAAPSI